MHQRGDIATSFFAKASPWHIEGARPRPEYDPDKARFLLKKARAVGVVVDLMANSSWPYMQQTGELLQAMWTDVGFKVNYNPEERLSARPSPRSGRG